MLTKKILLFICLLFATSFPSIADISVSLDPPTSDDPVPDGTIYGKRKTPPAPVLCFIDFEAGTVSFSSATIGEIEEYQICNESGETCIGCYDDPAEFVAALSSIDGDLCIRFLSPKGYYTGYITE